MIYSSCETLSSGSLLTFTKNRPKAGDIFSLASICSSTPFPWYCPSLTLTVFQPHLDILGIVIYATEFILWCGIFVAGGYYNLTPWIRTRMSLRAQRKREELEPQQAGSNTPELELERMASSTSVFRTPSSVVRERG